MYDKVSTSFINVATKLFSNVLVQSPRYQLTHLQCRYCIQTHALKARGYSSVENPSTELNEEYNKMYEEKLNKLLQDPQYKAHYDSCKLEMEYYKSYTNRVPEKLTTFNWLTLLKADTRSRRRSYLEFLWKLERKEENELRKKQIKKVQREMEKESLEDSEYGLHKCTMFFRIRQKTMMDYYNLRAINAMLFEPALVFDLGYDQYMTPFEQHNCAKQLLLTFSSNRVHNSPFNLYFCNAKKHSTVMQQLHKSMPTMYNTEFPLNITPKSYLDVFDKEKLVYLTPHTNNVMRRFDPNLVYIVGAMVDKTNPQPVSFQKANREGIKMMRLPLKEKLNWGTGSGKSLPLNQILSILLDLKESNDWEKALEHVPRRKLRDARDHAMMRKIRQREMILSGQNVE